MSSRGWRFFVEQLPVALGTAAVVVTIAAWALGEPTPAPMLQPGGKQTLPLVDAPCANEMLLAQPRLTDPHFVGTAILVCHHGDEGTLGFVVNRPATVLARSVAGFGPLEWGFARAGGPLSVGEGVILHRKNGVLHFTTQRPRHPFPSTGWLRTPQIAREDVVLVVTGYAGWSPGQLEGELQQGAWVVSPLDYDAWLAREK